MFAQKSVSRALLQVVASATVLAALPYAADAEARGGRRFGFFAGGVVVGAVLAPRYVYAAPPYYYYPPVAYYPPYPATVTYVQPPVVVQQAAPAQSNATTMSPPMGIEDRLRRLRSMCDQGLFTESECHNRREQILQEM